MADLPSPHSHPSGIATPPRANTPEPDYPALGGSSRQSSPSCRSVKCSVFTDCQLRASHLSTFHLQLYFIGITFWMEINPDEFKDMNQTCKVCGEPAAGFHFGAFTCEGCKSFFGRSYNNLGSISECKNNGECVINKKNRTSCKACRLRKCLLVGMSKSGSRYGRRSNWFKIHCLLQEQKAKAEESRLGQQIATINRSKDELFLLGLDEYKTASSPSISSPGSDSSEEKYRRSVEPASPYFYSSHHHMMPPMFLPPLYHPTFLPPVYTPTVTRPWEDLPMDLSVKSTTDESESASVKTESSEEESINVEDDEVPSPVPDLMRTPLDLTTKVA